MKNLKLILCLLPYFLIFLCCTSSYCALPNESVIEIKNSELLINGKSFIIKGVCYSPIKVGEGEKYDWTLDNKAFRKDLVLIKKMGANVVRLYSYSYDNLSEFLDECKKNDIRVILGFEIDKHRIENIEYQNEILGNAKEIVGMFGNHSALLMWCIGNEINTANFNYAKGYSFLNKVAVCIHDAEAKKNYHFHPVCTANCDFVQISAYEKYMPDLDIWGINLYRGKNFKELWEQYKSDKPFFISEFGCDAFDSRISAENQNYQNSYIESQMNDITIHLKGDSGVKGFLGCTIFEWCDEWWKSNNNTLHDTISNWESGNYEDTKMNEEWWGIVSVKPDSYNRIKRKAYFTLQRLWK
jgi:hypothetical protein